MAKIFFNDKQSGDSLTATNVNDIKAAINTNADQLESDISSLHLQDSAGGSSTTAESISNGTVSGYYDSNDQFRYNHHIIPESNANFDIGNAEYKVRHLYLSSNSLWLGDETKIDASTDGTIQTKKRDKSKLPNYITEVLGGTLENAYSFLNVDYAHEITLKGLEEYAKSLNPNVTLSDIFPAEDSANYQESDYETKTSINQNKNQRKKIYINYDSNTLSPIIPTLDLSQNTDFEFYIDNDATAWYEANFGEIPVRLIPTEHNLNKFNVFISKPASPEDYNGEFFNSGSIFYIAFSNNGGSMSFKIEESNVTVANQSHAIHFECTHVKNPNDIDDINALSGTLYTKYNYYGDLMLHSDDGRGAA